MRRVWSSLVALIIGAFLLGAGVVAVATTANPCEKVFTSASVARLQDYIDCRDDQIQATQREILAGQKRIEDKLATSPSPSPTVQPSSPAPSSPAPSSPAPSTPAPSPTAGTCANPSITFTGNGSQGVGDGYDISAEQWGVTGYNYKSTLRFCSKDSWNVDITTDNVKGDGAVKAYPSIRKIYHDWSGTDFSKDPRLSSFPTLTADFAADDPGACTGCIYNVAFDNWLNGIASSTSTEQMIWTHNVAQRPAGSVLKTNVTIDGRSWTVWATADRGIVTFVPTTGSIPSGTMDVGAFIRYQVDNQLIRATSLTGGTTDPYVGQVSFGVEPVSTNGVSQRWDFTRFNVNDA